MGLLKDVIMPGIGAMQGRKKKQDSSGLTSRPGKVGGYSQEDESGSTQSFKRGGKVKRTGLARVHKGERVLTRAQAKRYKRRGGSKR